jgi:hypothetical protein
MRILHRLTKYPADREKTVTCSVIDGCSHQLRVFSVHHPIDRSVKTSCGQVSPLISHPSMHIVPPRDEDTGDDAEIARILGELELQDACTRSSPSRPLYPRPPPRTPSPLSAAPPPYSSGHSFSIARRHQDSRALLPATPTRTYHYRTPTSQGDTTEWYVAPRLTFLLVNSFYPPTGRQPGLPLKASLVRTYWHPPPVAKTKAKPPLWRM